MAGSTAKLTLQLVDGVTGPAGRITGALRGVNNTLRGMKDVALAPSRAINGMATGMRQATHNLTPAGVAVGMGVRKVATDIYNMEKELNVSVAAGGLDMAQRNEFMERAIELNAQYAATASEIVQAGNKLLRAGLDYDQMMGSLPGVLSTAQAMDVSMEAASTAVVDSMVSMRMAMEDTKSTMESSIRIADLYAHAVNETTGELDDFATSSKYFNPVAASIGMSPEEAMAYQISLAKAGIKGSSAGTGLRAAPVRIAAPSDKSLATMARLGIDNTDFLGDRTGNVTGAGLAAVLESQGFSAEGIEEEIDRIIANPAFNNAPVALANAIMENFSDALGIATAEDKTAISTMLQRAIMAGSSEVDLIGFLKAMKAADAGVADYASVFGLHHASKMQALDPDMFDEILRKIEAEAAGTSKRMREAMMAGIVGDVAELTAAIEGMSIAIGRSGILGDAAAGIDRLAKALNSLAGSNPDLLRFASYAALALVSLPALGFAAIGAAAGLALLVNPLAWAAAGLGTLVALNFEPIVNGLRSLGWGFSYALDKDVAERLRSTGQALREFLGSSSLESWDLLKVGSDVGASLARTINAIYKGVPRLREAGAALFEFAQGQWTANLPVISNGVESLKGAFDGFVGSKVDGIMQMVDSLAGFGERALPYLKQIGEAGIPVIAASFETLAAGFNAVGRVLGSVTTGFVDFASAFLDNIDPEAMQSIANGFGTVMTFLGEQLGGVRDAFNSVDLDLGAAAANAGAAAGRLASGIIDAIANLPETLRYIWGQITAVFTEIGSYVPSFGGIIGAISSFASKVAELAGQVAAAVQKMLEAVRSLPGGAGGSIIGGPGISNVAPTGGGYGIGAMGGAALPKKASGGAVRRGMTYQINERGTETVTMGTNGYVTPAHRVGEGRGGGDTITIHVNGAGNPEAVAAAVERRLSNRLGRSRQVSIDR